MTNEHLTKNTVKNLVITDPYCGQRIDNFLFNYFKNIPKGRIYKGVRKGEVRVNGKRVQPLYKLQSKDVVRLPPFVLTPQEKQPKASTSLWHFIQSHILYEDKNLMILNKPSGLAVHGGSGIKIGLIEVLKQHYSSPDIELVHRLDKETSGCLLIAKKRSVLKELHKQLLEHKIKKTYLALLKGTLSNPEYIVNFPLTRKEGSTHKVVKVSLDGKPALTIFRPLQRFKHCTLVEVELHTGRMHQIRVHAKAIGHPVALDDKYGDKLFNEKMQTFGLKRLFLHAAMLDFKLSTSENRINLCACLETDLLKCLRKL